MTSVLVVGASSLVGKGIINYYSDNGLSNKFSFYLTSRNTFNIHIKNEFLFYFDLSDKKGISRVITRVEPAVIIYIASEGSIDFCEEHKETARKINVDSLNDFIDAIEDRETHMIYLSSNAVFSGNNPPYDEESCPDPVNYYGETKFRAEEIVRKRLYNRYTIVRPTLLLGFSNYGRRPSAMEFFYNKLQKGEKVKAVDDIFTNPLHTKFLAHGIWMIIDNPGISKNQIFHFGGRDRLSRYDMVMMLCDFFGFSPGLVERVDSSAFPEMAKRMPDTTFITTKAEKAFHWEAPSLNRSFEIMKSEAANLP